MCFEMNKSHKRDTIDKTNSDCCKNANEQQAQDRQQKYDEKLAGVSPKSKDAILIRTVFLFAFVLLF
jgi:hypothetical protein